MMQPIEDYNIQFDKLIGQGAFGEVFIIKNVNDETEIVVKRTKITKKNSSQKEGDMVNITDGKYKYKTGK